MITLIIIIKLIILSKRKLHLASLFVSVNNENEWSADLEMLKKKIKKRKYDN